MAKPTDDEILEVVRETQVAMTYVVRNVLARKFKGLDTAFVRRRLMELEKAGKVCRKPTSYAVQICWGVAPSSQKGAAE